MITWLELGITDGISVSLVSAWPWQSAAKQSDFFLWGAMKNSVYSNNPHTLDDLKMAVTEYIRNVDCAILNAVFENTVQRVNKCLETGGGHFEHYL
jgi:hypothetical protein